MARGMHRHRRIRLDNLRDTKAETRAQKRPGKIKARVRRDANVIAKIKATKAENGYSPEVKSWISAQLEKPFWQVTADEIAALTA
jgi:hypothetical protein